MDIQKITGLIAAPSTPMNRDGSLNTSMIPDYTAKLKKYDGPFAAGKTLMQQVSVYCGPCRLPIKNLQGINYENFVN